MMHCPHRLIALLLAVFVLSLSSSSAAQNYGDPLGDIWLSFDPDLLETQTTVESGGTFEWYVLVNINFPDPDRDAVDGINAWEALIEVPSEISILERELFENPLTCTNGVCGDDWYVLLNGCILGNEGQTRVLRYRGQLLNDVQDVELKLMPGAFNSFDGTAPGWSICQSTGNPVTDLHPFGNDWSQSIVINSSVPTKNNSWAAVKALY